jgi:hypothetical protein
MDGDKFGKTELILTVLLLVVFAFSFLKECSPTN